MELSEEWGWAELSGHEGGSLLGIAQESPEMNAGQNAVVTFEVDHLERVIEEMCQKGAKIEGDIIDIPGHVKMQTMVDSDGNRFQMCQKYHSCCHC